MIPTHKSKNKQLWSDLRNAQYSFVKKSLKNIRDGSTLLDVGSGPHHFEDLYTSYKKTSLDFAPYEGTDLIHDLERGLPFDDESYEIITSLNTFEHIYRVKELIKDCYRVTKKNGVLIGSTPFQLCVHQEPFDYFRYTQFALKKMMEEAGYVDIVITSLGTHEQLLKQTLNHYFSSLEGSLRRKSRIHRITLRVFWKLHTVLNKLTQRAFGNLAYSDKHTLGYGFTARKA